MKVLPATKSVVLRWTLVGLSVMSLFASFWYAQSAIFQHPAYWILALLTCLQAVGLWLRHPIARQSALIFLWFIVVIIPMGTINPFFAMDMPNPPPAWRLIAFFVLPWVVPALFAIHILDKHKNEFR
jgi:hypothetical protein